ncbi:coagulation factor V [Gastrophryne carolinensis]
MDPKHWEHSISVVLLVLATLGHFTPAVSGLVREYYIAAETIDWDYSNGKNQSSEYVFKKIVYKEYEQGFQKAKHSSKLTGILGPTLRAEVGDVLKVHFKNKATKPLTIHPQGIAYGKTSEGAKYADGTRPKEKLDDSVLPGQTYLYSWDITETMGPTNDDPDCLTSIYYSTDNMVQDVNSGLIGSLLICKTGSLRDDGSQRNFNKDFILFFAIFDESKSWRALPSPKLKPIMYTINGYVQGTGPDFKTCVDDRISWHILGMSSKPEFFSVHFFGQTLQQNEHRLSVIRLVSSSSITANMTVTQSGRWAITSFNEKHIEVGMEAYLDVQQCSEKVRSGKRQSVFQTRYIKRWENYIAAVEEDWDYSNKNSDNPETSSCHQTFKKVVYKQYTDSSFKTQTDPERSKKELGLIGPVIRAQVKDTVMVVFKNMASHPHNIYPHGVSLQRAFKGYAPDLKGEELQNSTVMPGDTVTYYWTVLDNDEPTKYDPQCLTRIYHSTVNIVKDMASGLLGTLLICKSMALNTRGLQEKADEEQIAMFAVFDENKSWYYETNKLKTCSWMLTKDPTYFYNSYVINTINGNNFEKAILGFCHNHVVQWHVSSIGIWDETLTLQLSGHTFSYRGGNGALVSLFPMTSESIITEMNNQGIWIFGTLNFKEKPGMKVRFRDAKCISSEDYDQFKNDYFEFDYDDDDDTNDVTIEVRNNEDESSEIDIVTPDEEEDYSENLASIFHIRSLKNNTNSTEEAFNLADLVDDKYGTHDMEDQYTHTTVPATEFVNSVTVIPKHTKVILNETKEVYLLSQNSTNTEDQENILETNDTTYFQEAEHSKEEQDSSDQTEEIMNATKEIHLASKNISGTEGQENIIDDENEVTKYFQEAENGREEQDISGQSEDIFNETKEMNLLIENSTGTTDQENIIEANGENEVTTYFQAAENVKEEQDISDQTKDIFNESKEVDLITQNSTGTTGQENIIETNRKNEVTKYFQDIEENERTNISEVVQHISVVKRDLEKAANGTVLDFDLSDTKQKNKSKDAVLDKVSTTPLTEDALQFIEKEEEEYLELTSKAAEEKIFTTPSNTIENIYDYRDKETEDMLGTHIFEDIMKAILHQGQNNETNTTNLVLTLAEEENAKANECNQTCLSSIEKTQQNTQNEKKQKRKIIYVRKMEKFQTADSGNSSIRYRKQIKPIGKIKEKRTANSGYNTLNMSNGTWPGNKYVSSNTSLDDGNITLSPRGFNPRGLNPRGHYTRIKEVMIGIPRDGGDGEYDEHDPNSEFFDETEETPKLMIAFEEPYKIITDDDKNRYTNPDRIIQHFLRSSKGTQRIYYIAAEEVQWDYSGQTIRYNINEKPVTESRETVYKKVIFRRYLDGTFTKPDVNGEYEEHLGILGPVIRAEVEDVIQVTFKNLATRPYSIHAHGVSYEKSSEGYSYADETEDWLKTDDIVKPGETYVYVWYATKQSGPEPEGSACRTWAYHSGVNIEKDIHSGLIGPLLICRNGTLDKQNYRPVDAREFILLFMTFEEEKSWYFDKSKKTCKDIAEKPSETKKCHIYHAINGIIYNLQGLQMYQDELVRWHLLNMGSPKDSHVIHFHGQTVTESIKAEHRLAVYPLIAGSFATVEMKPSSAGFWQLDTEVAEYQQAGMQTIFHIAEPVCKFPLGLASKLISDDQITASHYIDYWEPKLARLNNVGSYNAWSTNMNKSALPWIQVDLQKTFLISAIQTQGASKYFSQYYVTEFFVVYSKDKRKWTAFKGNSTALHKLFQGNVDSSTIKENVFEPPIAARYIRIYPTKYNNKPTLRMELLGCEIQGCSAPMGMETHQIKDEQITASSYKSPWFSAAWLPSLARLNKVGSVNAWQAKANNNQQWLQIDFLRVKKITGIMTQGAKQFTTEMYVQSYSIHYSDNGKNWKPYLDDSSSMEKIFKGNSNNSGYAKNHFEPPIYSQFLRIIPKSWYQSIVLRVELYGCDV